MLPHYSRKKSPGPLREKKYPNRMTFSGRKDNEIVYYDLMLSSKKKDNMLKKKT